MEGFLLVYLPLTLFIGSFLVLLFIKNQLLSKIVLFTNLVYSVLFSGILLSVFYFGKDFIDEREAVFDSHLWVLFVLYVLMSTLFVKLGYTKMKK